jgi:hypothetical protein
MSLDWRVGAALEVEIKYNFLGIDFLFGHQKVCVLEYLVHLVVPIQSRSVQY